MSMALKMIGAYLEAKKIKFKVNEERNLIELGFNAENKDSVQLMIFVDSNDRGIAIRSFDYCKFPAAKASAMYELCSDMNKEYRWVKFYVDKNDNTVTLSDDAVIQLDSCGEEVWELIFRMVSIADEAYPKFMKLLWS